MSESPISILKIHLKFGHDFANNYRRVQSMVRVHVFEPFFTNFEQFRPLIQEIDLWKRFRTSLEAKALKQFPKKCRNLAFFHQKISTVRARIFKFVFDPCLIVVLAIDLCFLPTMKL